MEFACQSMFENLIIYFLCINLVLDFLRDRTVSRSKILMGGGLRSIPKFQVDLVDTGPLENSLAPRYCVCRCVMVLSVMLLCRHVMFMRLMVLCRCVMVLCVMLLCRYVMVVRECLIVSCHTPARPRTHARMHARTRVRARARAYTHTHTHTHARTNARTHTYTHTHTHIDSQIRNAGCADTTTVRHRETQRETDRPIDR